ncbi:MAG TPA: nucleoside permease [Candidatus Aquilonibacter sp.]|nr:nucleoside permease [Candidatus Aquilonibacter sp.]
MTEANGYAESGAMPLSIRLQLSLMMFLNYVIWGAWYVTIDTYLTSTLHFTGTEAGAVFGTAALASMISPFFVGLVADRFFSSERVLACLHFTGAVLLFLVTRVTSFSGVYALMFIYCLCYFPTVALTNSIALQHLSNAGRDFPLIRVFGTFGWITIGVTISLLAVEKSASQFLIAAAASVLMGLFSLTLPHTPPKGRGKEIHAREILGLDALVMLKRPAYAVFAAASVLACIPLTFYFSFTNDYLNEVHVHNAAGKMALGQVSEVGMMLLMPFLLRRMTVRNILLVGMLSWTVRYVLLAYGNAGALMWMFYVAILLHGVCYDFFFVTGQLYTDQEAPSHLRSAAQGLITFLTYGVGMFIGSLSSGATIDHFTHVVSGVAVRNWQSFWLTSAGSAFVVLLLIALFFRSHSRIKSE